MMKNTQGTEMQCWVVLVNPPWDDAIDWTVNGIFASKEGAEARARIYNDRCNVYRDAMNVIEVEGEGLTKCTYTSIEKYNVED